MIHITNVDTNIQVIKKRKNAGMQEPEQKNYAALYSELYQQCRNLKFTIPAKLTSNLIKGDQTAWLQLRTDIEKLDTQKEKQEAKQAALKIIDTAVGTPNSAELQFQKRLAEFKNSLVGKQLTDYPDLLAGLETRWKQVMAAQNEQFFVTSADFNAILQIVEQVLSDRLERANDPTVKAVIKMITKEVAAQQARLEVARAFSTTTDLSELAAVVSNYAEKIDLEVRRKQMAGEVALNSVLLGKLVNRLQLRHRYFGKQWHDVKIPEFSLENDTKTFVQQVDSQPVARIIMDPQTAAMLPDGFVQHALRVLNTEPKDGCLAEQYIQQVAKEANSVAEQNIELSKIAIYLQYPIENNSKSEVRLEILPRLIRAANTALHKEPLTEKNIEQAVQLIPHPAVQAALRRIWRSEIHSPPIQVVQEKPTESALNQIARETNLILLADLLQRLKEEGYTDINEAVATLSLQDVPADILTDRNQALQFLMTRLKRLPALARTPDDFQRKIIVLVLKEMRAVKPERQMNGSSSFVGVLNDSLQRLTRFFRRIETGGSSHRENIQFDGDKYRIKQISQDLGSTNAGSWELTFGRDKGNSIQMKGQAVPKNIGKFRFDTGVGANGAFYFVPGRTSTRMRWYSSGVKEGDYKGLGPNVSVYLKEGRTILEFNRNDTNETLDMVIQVTGKTITIKYPTK